ncbi:phosphatase [Brachybacterium vulturis]|uniref:Phosphatase n=1 Tax=Brachybacterium vulturis TaxID=2017484 RepID=A0A291GKG3_9MICO|nr:phosphatase [Brachybacterium vulturis]
MASISLPLLMKDAVRGKRSPVTCALKCGNQCAFGPCNHSDNASFRDIASAALSRRTMLGGSTAALAIGLAGTQGALAAPAGPVGTAPVGPAPAGPAPAGPTPHGTALDFTAIAPVDAMADEFTVPEGFTWHPVIRWGDPLFDDAPDFDWEAQTAEAQKLQFGYNNDYTEIQEIPDSDGTRAVMFVNHEYTNEAIMFPPDTGEDELIDIGMAAHGLTVVELERENAQQPYTYVKGAALNRRILLDTPFAVTGPAAGSDLLVTVDDPTGAEVLGTLGNCAGGLTPWGTLLSGEENFHGYFNAPGASEAETRYGLRSGATARGWELEHPRFDAHNEGYENEPNRFGYIVEIDPWDPSSTPRKHTSLGRLKHEGANVILAEDGRAVAYSGDDEVFDYLYKFVSRDPCVEGDRAHNMTLLEHGDLYVAKFSGNSPAAEIDGSGTVPSDGAFDGTGEWLPLVVDGESAVEGFTLEEVLVHTRLAADAVGPTKMDRCEDVEPSLQSRHVYVACTNNSGRGTEGKAPADEMNPRAENRDGHVIEIDEQGDQTSSTFAWNLLLVCGDPAQGDQTYFSGFPADQVSPISCPDNLAFDSVGNLWISTDGAPSGIGYNDGLFRVTLEGAARGRVEQFLSVPRDGETCGPIVRDQDRTAFVAVQHPGEDGTYEEQFSCFPDYDGKGPRPAVVQVLPTSEEPEHPFTDMGPGDEHYESVRWAYENGIAKGWQEADGSSTFRPLLPVNRDAMAAFLHRLAGAPEVDHPRSEPFRDVAKGQEHYDAIIWAYQMGITTGWPDRTFRPTQPINRDAMAAFVHRYAGSPDVPAPTERPFQDVPVNGLYAAEIAWLEAEGITTGWKDGTYRPLSPMNRDATAAFLQRMTQEQNITFRSLGG